MSKRKLSRDEEEHEEQGENKKDSKKAKKRAKRIEADETKAAETPSTNVVGTSEIATDATKEAKETDEPKKKKKGEKKKKPGKKKKETLGPLSEKIAELRETLTKKRKRQDEKKKFVASKTSKTNANEKDQEQENIKPIGDLVLHIFTNIGVSDSDFLVILNDIYGILQRTRSQIVINSRSTIGEEKLFSEAGLFKDSQSFNQAKLKTFLSSDEHSKRIKWIETLIVATSESEPIAATAATAATSVNLIRMLIQRILLFRLAEVSETIHQVAEGEENVNLENDETKKSSTIKVRTSYPFKFDNCVRKLLEIFHFQGSLIANQVFKKNEEELLIAFTKQAKNETIVTPSLDTICLTLLFQSHNRDYCPILFYLVDHLRQKEKEKGKEKEKESKTLSLSNDKKTFSDYFVNAKTKKQLDKWFGTSERWQKDEKQFVSIESEKTIRFNTLVIAHRLGYPVAKNYINSVLIDTSKQELIKATSFINTFTESWVKATFVANSEDRNIWNEPDTIINVTNLRISGRKLYQDLLETVWRYDTSKKQIKYWSEMITRWALVPESVERIAINQLMSFHLLHQNSNEFKYNKSHLPNLLEKAANDVINAPFLSNINQQQQQQQRQLFKAQFDLLRFFFEVHEKSTIQVLQFGPKLEQYIKAAIRYGQTRLAIDMTLTLKKQFQTSDIARINLYNIFGLVFQGSKIIQDESDQESEFKSDTKQWQDELQRSRDAQLNSAAAVSVAILDSFVVHSVKTDTESELKNENVADNGLFLSNYSWLNLLQPQNIKVNEFIKDAMSSWIATGKINPLVFLANHSQLQQDISASISSNEKNALQALQRFLSNILFYSDSRSTFTFHMLNEFFDNLVNRMHRKRIVELKQLSAVSNGEFDGKTRHLLISPEICLDPKESISYDQDSDYILLVRYFSTLIDSSRQSGQVTQVTQVTQFQEEQEEQVRDDQLVDSLVLLVKSALVIEQQLSVEQLSVQQIGKQNKILRFIIESFLFSDSFTRSERTAHLILEGKHKDKATDFGKKLLTCILQSPWALDAFLKRIKTHKEAFVYFSAKQFESRYKSHPAYDLVLKYLADFNPSSETTVELKNFQLGLRICGQYLDTRHQHADVPLLIQRSNLFPKISTSAKTGGAKEDAHRIALDHFESKYSFRAWMELVQVFSNSFQAELYSLVRASGTGTGTATNLINDKNWKLWTDEPFDWLLYAQLITGFFSIPIVFFKQELKWIKQDIQQFVGPAILFTFCSKLVGIIDPSIILDEAPFFKLFLADSTRKQTMMFITKTLGKLLNACADDDLKLKLNISMMSRIIRIQPELVKQELIKIWLNNQNVQVMDNERLGNQLMRLIFSETGGADIDPNASSGQIVDYLSVFVPLAKFFLNSLSKQQKRAREAEKDDKDEKNVNNQIQHLFNWGRKITSLTSTWNSLTFEDYLFKIICSENDETLIQSFYKQRYLTKRLEKFNSSNFPSLSGRDTSLSIANELKEQANEELVQFAFVSAGDNERVNEMSDVVKQVVTNYVTIKSDLGLDIPMTKRKQLLSLLLTIVDEKQEFKTKILQDIESIDLVGVFNILTWSGLNAKEPIPTDLWTGSWKFLTQNCYMTYLQTLSYEMVNNSFYVANKLLKRIEEPEIKSKSIIQTKQNDQTLLNTIAAIRKLLSSLNLFFISTNDIVDISDINDIGEKKKKNERKLERSERIPTLSTVLIKYLNIAQGFNGNETQFYIFRQAIVWQRYWQKWQRQGIVVLTGTLTTIATPATTAATATAVATTRSLANLQEFFSKLTSKNDQNLNQIPFGILITFQKKYDALKQYILKYSMTNENSIAYFNRFRNEVIFAFEYILDQHMGALLENISHASPSNTINVENFITTDGYEKPKTFSTIQFGGVVQLVKSNKILVESNKIRIMKTLLVVLSEPKNKGAGLVFFKNPEPQKRFETFLKNSNDPTLDHVTLTDRVRAEIEGLTGSSSATDTSDASSISKRTIPKKPKGQKLNPPLFRPVSQSALAPVQGQGQGQALGQTLGQGQGQAQGQGNEFNNVDFEFELDETKTTFTKPSENADLIKRLTVFLSEDTAGRNNYLKRLGNSDQEYENWLTESSDVLTSLAAFLKRTGNKKFATRELVGQFRQDKTAIMGIISTLATKVEREENKRNIEAARLKRERQDRLEVEKRGELETKQRLEREQLERLRLTNQTQLVQSAQNSAIEVKQKERLQKAQKEKEQQAQKELALALENIGSIQIETEPDVETTVETETQSGANQELGQVNEVDDVDEINQLNESESTKQAQSESEPVIVSDTLAVRTGKRKADRDQDQIQSTVVKRLKRRVE